MEEVQMESWTSLCTCLGERVSGGCVSSLSTLPLSIHTAQAVVTQVGRGAT